MQYCEMFGFGDYIEVKKDKNKVWLWIIQFLGMLLVEVIVREWKVKKDGGCIDYYVGVIVMLCVVLKVVFKVV